MKVFNKPTMQIGQPEFCYIAPINQLHRTVVSNRHLVLAHLINEVYSTNHNVSSKARQYINFYKNRSAAGDYIICDNSAFELGESFDTSALIQMAKIVDADALVLPDYPNRDSQDTISAAEAWIPEFKEAGLDTFFVPQSERGDLEGWIRSFEWAMNNKDVDIIGWSILGIPNALPHVPPAYARVVMAHILNERFDLDDPKTRKYNHFLGLNAGPALELPALIEMGILDGCDSSGPIWAAVNGVRYNVDCDSYMSVTKSMLPAVDFFTKQSSKNIDASIDNNIRMTQSIFGRDVSNHNDVNPMKWVADELNKSSL